MDEETQEDRDPYVRQKLGSGQMDWRCLYCLEEGHQSLEPRDAQEKARPPVELQREEEHEDRSRMPRCTLELTGRAAVLR